MRKMDLHNNFPKWPNCQVCNELLMSGIIIRKPLYCCGCKKQYNRAAFHACCAQTSFDREITCGINTINECCRCTFNINKMFVNKGDVCKYLLNNYRPSDEEISKFFKLGTDSIEFGRIIKNIDTVENYDEKYNCDKDIIKELCENICVTNNLDIENIREIIMNERVRGSGLLTKRAV